MILPKPESIILGRSPGELREIQECFKIMSEYVYYLSMRRQATRNLDTMAERINNEAVQLRWMLLPDWARTILREI